MNSDLKPEDRIILALNSDSPTRLRRIIMNTMQHIRFFKVGCAVVHNPALRLDVLDFIRKEWRGYKRDLRLFYDPKFCDIPSEVAHAVRSIAQTYEIDLISVCSCRGPALLKAAADAVPKNNSARIAGITLTSAMSMYDAWNLYDANPITLVRRMVTCAVENGAGAIVCPPSYLDMVKRIIDISSSDGAIGTQYEALKLIVPGIRPDWAAGQIADDDQSLPVTPYEAIRRGADYIIIGRPIVASSVSPREAAERIIEEIADAS